MALTRELVSLDSRNPSLVPGGPGEHAASVALAAVLRDWGFRVAVQEAAPGRPNVIARIGGRGPSLMLNGHLDVVGVEGMTHAPFDAEIRDGRIYGRGSADMKGGVAAMCAAAARASAAGGAGGELGGEVIIAAVADEEFESIGTRSLIASGIRASAAIVTEPTRLAIAPAHRGFAWIELIFHGRAAHGSRYDIGIDAIRHAGLLLVELDLLEEGELSCRTHPLLGHASLHASTIAGGIGWSTYPDRCVLTIERRMLPGEADAQVLEEVSSACDRVRSRRPALQVEMKLSFSQRPSDVAISAPIVRALSGAITAGGDLVRIEGLSAWTDAALLNDAGIPAICYGPGDISMAHAAEEWVPVAEIERATETLTRLIELWCSGTASTV
ncbi:MAG: ArgE/DapE family deacylase [Gemmatimonadaceae bacterium]